MFGFLNIDKPDGPTSHDIVARVRRDVGRGVKVGHAGTLDPFATGVLIMCLGHATRLAAYVQAAPKRYRADIHLGATSTTDDCEGDIIPSPGAVAPPAEAVSTVCREFLGEIQQIPPAHSAVHVDGQRAYKLARQGQAVEIAPRTVTVHTLEILDYTWPRLTVEITCGSGTYIRAIARDIGAALNVGGYCQTLRRLAVGAFTADAASHPDALDLPTDVADPRLALAGWETYTLPPSLRPALEHGNALALADLVPAEPAYAPLPGTTIPSGWAALTDETGMLLALAQHKADLLQPRKVFCRD